MKLNTEQQKAVELILTGQNTCIVGGGGVGKSYLLNRLKQILGNKAVFAAPTGRAALNIGGVTAHSLVGLPLGFPTETELKKITRKAKQVFSCNTVEYLVLDEVFMLRADAFYAMDVKLRRIKKNDKPFGGLTLVVVGDMFQLEPVLRENTKEADLVLEAFGGKYVFHTDVWDELNFKYVVLNKIERTSDDTFKYHLENIRFGRNLDESIQWFNQQCYKKRCPRDTLHVVTTNKKADEQNLRHHKMNPNPERSYNTSSWGTWKPGEEPTKRNIKLKKDMQVILTANEPNGLYQNGTLGIVSELSTGFITVELPDGAKVDVEPFKWSKYDYVVDNEQLEQVVVGEFTQLPVLQADALTVHRVQGATLEEAVIDFGWGCFAAGMCYVALSRLTNKEKLHLSRPLKEEDVIVEQDVLDFYQEILSKVG